MNAATQKNSASQTEIDRHINCERISAEGVAKSAEFEEWAKKQTTPYYLKLNKWRLNEGNRWYASERTQHTFEGFNAALDLLRGKA